MKKYIKHLLWAVFAALFVTSCGPIAQTITPQKYSNAIMAPGVKPLHVGNVFPYTYGVYHVQIYKRSVIFKTTTKLVEPNLIEVFDLDFDNQFDCVYIRTRNVWSVGFTKEFRSRNKTVQPTLSQQKTLEWIGIATRLHALYQQKPVAIRSVTQQKNPRQTATVSHTPPTTPNVMSRLFGEWVFPPPIEMGIWVD